MKAPMYETVPAAEPTLAETCAVLKRELGLSGSITEVISGACRALGVDDTGTIVARAAKCREVLGLGTGGDVAAGAALAGTVVEAAPAGTFVGAEAGPTIVGVAAPAVAGTVIGFVAPTAQPIEPFAAPAASGRTHHFQYRPNVEDGPIVLAPVVGVEPAGLAPQLTAAAPFVTASGVPMVPPAAARSPAETHSDGWQGVKSCDECLDTVDALLLFLQTHRPASCGGDDFPREFDRGNNKKSSPTHVVGTTRGRRWA